MDTGWKPYQAGKIYMPCFWLSTADVSLSIGVKTIQVSDKSEQFTEMCSIPFRH